MGKKKHKRQLRLKKVEERCDRRSADFVMRQIEAIETALADLVPEMQALTRYDDMTMTTICLEILKRMRKRYRKLADGAVCDDDL